MAERTPAHFRVRAEKMGQPPEGDQRICIEADARPSVSSAGLIALPEIPRQPSESYPEATGPMADAAIRSTELLLRIAGVNLTPRILQGEDQLEVELSGADVDWCFADDGELVLSMEHLLPRMIRSLAGKEPRLRILAHKVVYELRSRTAQPKKVESHLSSGRQEQILAELVSEGLVARGEGELTAFKPLRIAGKSLSETLLDDRNDRI
jgi:hypothetical protein